MKYKLIDGELVDEDGNIVDNEDLKNDDTVNDISITVIKKDDEVADTLTDADLDKKITKLVDDKIALAQTAHDDEEEHQEEDQEDEKGIGLFPMLLIGGVAIVAVASVFMKNRPISSPEHTTDENRG